MRRTKCIVPHLNAAVLSLDGDKLRAVKMQEAAKQTAVNLDIRSVTRESSLCTAS